MTHRKNTPGSKKRRSGRKVDLPANQKLKVIFAGLFLLGFVGICLLLLSYLRDSYLPQKPHAPYEEPAVKQSPPQHTFAEVYAVVEAELLNGQQSQGWQKLPAEGQMQRLKMFGDYPDDSRLQELSAQIAAAGAAGQLDLLPRKGLVRLYWQGELRLELRYRVPLAVSSTRPKIAIIMDDMGRDLKTFRQLLDIDLLVTPSILPESSYATKSALLLQQVGREYMIHIPMQPRSYPKVSPGPNALLLGLSEKQIRQLVRHYMERVPGAVGGNNHMGSRFTEERWPMRIVLSELQQEGQFFVDSKTIATSVGYDEARKLGVPTARRNIFLDNEENVTYIRQQLRKMVRMGDERGKVVAICHPYPETLEAIRQELDWMKQQPVDFVAASNLVQTFQ